MTEEIKRSKIRPLPMKRPILAVISIVLCLYTFNSALVLAENGSFTQKDRELLIRLDERLNQVDKRFEQINKRLEELREDMNKRFEQVDKRFEQVDKRFEQVDKRFEEQNKRFEEQNRRFDTLQQLMIAIVAAFTAIVTVTIGFAIWDRTTMIRKARDEAIERIEKEGRLQDLLRALRAYAKRNRELAEILRSFNLL